MTKYKLCIMNQWAHNCFLLTAHDPVATITSSGEKAIPGDQATFTCSATGLAANTFVYGWLLNGAPVERETRQKLIVTASIKTAGDYQCTAKNVYGGFGRSNVATLSLSKIIIMYTSILTTMHALFVLQINSVPQ